jgi:hypothetical protein
MALATGTRIGPYEVTSPLGEGGMGVVVRARDVKLQRDVALKLLPDHFADDADRLSRFLREAQILASLNHPNIAQIYGLEESATTRMQPRSFSPNGKSIAFDQIVKGNAYDILALPLDLSDPDHPKPGPPQPLLSSPANERWASFSPDGKWIAYMSDESSRTEVYVRRVSEPGGKWQVSTRGGNMPIWSHKGNRIFYAEGLRIIAADY